MVYYFTSEDGHLIYMGKDKYENEELIKYGFPEDIWFHVSSLSSAHVYLRMNEGEKWRELPKDLIYQMCVLVKHNSIEGNKKECVNVVYTPCVNLKKTSDMDVGQVGFYKKKDVIKWKNVEKEKPIIKILYKTKEEKFPDLAKLRAEKERQIIAKRKKIQKNKRSEKRKEDQERKDEKDKWLAAKGDFMDTEGMASNKNQDAKWEDDDDDFM